MTVAGGRTSACGWMALFFCGVLALACAARAELVVYPEYPAALERDFAYAVSVTQKGGETKPLVRLAPDFKSVLPWSDGSILPVKMTAETFSE